jgi:3-hydroxyisobutyrate dehydrogenase-like beta-hydroxyacid dehydrogenase
LKLAILHPGDMGVTIGAAMQAAGHEVFWVAQGRGAQTCERARAAGFHNCAALAELVGTVQGIVSVCPPHAAVELARSVVASGFDGTYLDANAVAPDTAREIESLVGKSFVDGGIIGPPAVKQGSTRMYVSGVAAGEVLPWFGDGVLAVSAIAGGPGAASALKMCYAAYTKGAGALLLAIRAAAQAEGVTDALLAEWDLSQPGLARRSESAGVGAAPKAWRFVGEMREIAQTFRRAGVPGEFHDGAAEIYRRIETLQDSDNVTFDDVLALLNEGPTVHAH